MDGRINQVIEAIEAIDPDWEETLLILTADHGGIETGHTRFGNGYLPPPADDALVAEVLEIPWVAFGAGVGEEEAAAEGGVSLDRLQRYVNNIDTAPTALHALGVTAPADWYYRGQAVTQAFSQQQDEAEEEDQAAAGRLGVLERCLEAAGFSERDVTAAAGGGSSGGGGDSTVAMEIIGGTERDTIPGVVSVKGVVALIVLVVIALGLAVGISRHLEAKIRQRNGAGGGCHGGLPVTSSGGMVDAGSSPMDTANSSSSSSSSSAGGGGVVGGLRRLSSGAMSSAAGGGGSHGYSPIQPGDLDDEEGDNDDNGGQQEESREHTKATVSSDDEEPRTPPLRDRGGGGGGGDGGRRMGSFPEPEPEPELEVEAEDEDEGAANEDASRSVAAAARP